VEDPVESTSVPEWQRVVCGVFAAALFVAVCFSVWSLLVGETSLFNGVLAVLGQSALCLFFVYVASVGRQP